MTRELPPLVPVSPELEHLLWRAGFELEHLYGDFEGTPFSEGGNELVWIARAMRS